MTHNTFATKDVNPAGSNNGLLWTSVVAGARGNMISVTYVVSGNSTAESIAVSSDGAGNHITVTCSTDEMGAATSTANSIITLAADAAVAALAVPTSNEGDGTGAVAAVSRTFLAGGVDMGNVPSPSRDVLAQRKAAVEVIKYGYADAALNVVLDEGRQSGFRIGKEARAETGGDAVRVPIISA
jgi:hypothetical protein